MLYRIGPIASPKSANSITHGVYSFMSVSCFSLVERFLDIDTAFERKKKKEKTDQYVHVYIKKLFSKGNNNNRKHIDHENNTRASIDRSRVVPVQSLFLNSPALTHLDLNADSKSIAKSTSAADFSKILVRFCC